MQNINRLLFGLVLLLLSGCANKDVLKNSDIVIKQEDIQKFKDEYESLNGTISKSGKTHISVSIPDNSRIIYATEEDVVNLENGIVLFGFPSCPWCRNVIEPLLEFVNEEQISIYYLNIYDIRDKKELQDSIVVTTKEGSLGYQAILAKFYGELNPYRGLKVDSIKRISSPTVLYIKDNKAVYKVVSTVESHKNAYQKLNKQQHDELKQRYKNYFVNKDI